MHTIFFNRNRKTKNKINRFLKTQYYEKNTSYYAFNYMLFTRKHWLLFMGLPTRGICIYSQVFPCLGFLLNFLYHNVLDVFISYGWFSVSWPLTSWHYSGFGTKLSPFFGFAKSSKYKTIFKLSQIPKLLVACVTGGFFVAIIFFTILFSFFEFQLHCFIFDIVRYW